MAMQRCCPPQKASRVAICAVGFAAIGLVLYADACVLAAPAAGFAAGGSGACVAHRTTYPLGRKCWRQPPRWVAGSAGARSTYITLVDVSVASGKRDAFLEATLENARSSVREPANRRFDILQSEDQRSKIALVEIFSNKGGQIEHKETSHYSSWREAVDGLMGSPRKSSQWDSVFPVGASAFGGNAIILESTNPIAFNITHLFIDISPGQEDKFITATVPHAQAIIMNSGTLRCDVLRNVEKPSQFLICEVHRTNLDAAKQRRSKDYRKWRRTVEALQIKPWVSRRYTNIFPNLAAGWVCEAR